MTGHFNIPYFFGPYTEKESGQSVPDHYDEGGYGRIRPAPGKTITDTDGSDKLYGGKGDDTIYGSKTYDTLYGDDGDDTLYDGRGNNCFDGGAGADRLVFARKSTNTIDGFEDGTDILLITGGLEFSNLDIRQDGRNAVVSDSSGAPEIKLRDFDASLLTLNDFDFIA